MKIVEIMSIREKGWANLLVSFASQKEWCKKSNSIASIAINSQERRKSNAMPISDVYVIVHPGFSNGILDVTTVRKES